MNVRLVRSDSREAESALIDELKTVGIMLALLAGLLGSLAAEAADVLRGTGDLAIVIERADGTVQIVDTSSNASLGEVGGLGDLSHASAVYSRDGRYAYVFGRDGGLSKVDLLTAALVGRTVQAGNSIGGAISQDGRLIAVSNYTPGGVKVFDAASLALLADIPAEYAPGQLSKVIGLVDAPGQRFVFSLWDAGQIWVADLHDPSAPRIEKFSGIGANPYDALITADGRYYIAGLFGEDAGQRHRAGDRRAQPADRADLGAGPRRAAHGIRATRRGGLGVGARCRPAAGLRHGNLRAPGGACRQQTQRYLHDRPGTPDRALAWKSHRHRGDWRVSQPAWRRAGGKVVAVATT